MTLKQPLNRKIEQTKKCVDKHKYVKEEEFIHVTYDNNITKYVFKPSSIHTHKNNINQVVYQLFCFRQPIDV